MQAATGKHESSTVLCFLFCSVFLTSPGVVSFCVCFYDSCWVCPNLGLVACLNWVLKKGLNGEEAS